MKLIDTVQHASNILDAHQQGTLDAAALRDAIAALHEEHPLLERALLDAYGDGGDLRPLRRLLQRMLTRITTGYQKHTPVLVTCRDAQGKRTRLSVPYFLVRCVVQGLQRGQVYDIRIDDVPLLTAEEAPSGERGWITYLDASGTSC